MLRTRRQPWLMGTGVLIAVIAPVVLHALTGELALSRMLKHTPTHALATGLRVLGEPGWDEMLSRIGGIPRWRPRGYVADRILGAAEYTLRRSDSPACRVKAVRAACIVDDRRAEPLLMLAIYDGDFRVQGMGVTLLRLHPEHRGDAEFQAALDQIRTHAPGDLVDRLPRTIGDGR